MRKWAATFQYVFTSQKMSLVLFQILLAYRKPYTRNYFIKLFSITPWLQNILACFKKYTGNPGFSTVAILVLHNASKTF